MYLCDMIKSTAKTVCNIVADLLVAHGVKNVVLSPGSRNAPLIMALRRRPELNCPVVVDERSAAFVALGMSVESDRPVAIVCTSGTALLNYGPAVAEAYYRSVPLIVISADRPEEWIDQDDSQTLWQQNALAPYVKRSWDISDSDTPNALWFANRVVNDAMLEAVSGRRGPVHINVRLDSPLGREADYPADSARVIRMIRPVAELPTAEARLLGAELASPRRVLIVAGFAEPDERLNRALAKLAKLPNVVVMTETVANLHSPLFIDRIDATLCAVLPDERPALAPDVVITLGGALVSRHVKEWIRALEGVEHWHVGESHTTVDCFKHLSRRVEIVPYVFMRQLASAMQPHRAPCDFASRWAEVYHRGVAEHDKIIAESPWSDLRAFGYIVPRIPRGWNLQLSNGTPIRYAQLMDCSNIHRSDCNRGVSGIDGCTSTALGASVTYRGVTLLISGDMSFQYDIAALSSVLMSPRMKMIVICNGGGGIFRFIANTRSLPEVEPCFAVGTRLPLRQLAEGYGMNFYEASSEEELRKAFAQFCADTDAPAILAVNTPAQESAEILRRYFERD